MLRKFPHGTVLQPALLSRPHIVLEVVPVVRRCFLIAASEHWPQSVHSIKLATTGTNAHKTLACMTTCIQDWNVDVSCAAVILDPDHGKLTSYSINATSLFNWPRTIDGRESYNRELQVAENYIWPNGIRGCSR